MKPHWSDDAVTLYAGDCLDVLAQLADDSVDAVVTDPPYNLTFMGKSWDDHNERVDAGFFYWLSGLIDGEGCFVIKQHSRGTCAPGFALKMRADERGTLDFIRRKTGIGTIDSSQGDVNPMVRWAVQDKAGCQALVDILDQFPLRAKKQLDYLTWREAVCEWTDRPRGNRWIGASDQTRMSALRDRLMANRAYIEPAWSGNQFQDWCRLWSAECLRVLKPGGHLLAFGGSRTWHRLAAAVEDAGFEIRDSIAWLYGSGFPKSLDVSKAIDKAAGAEREVIGERTMYKRPSFNGNHDANGRTTDTYNDDPRRQQVRHDEPLTAPTTDAAKQWQGWGTALKPAFEPVVVARKPLAGTVAANVVEHGTGALNIDACRVNPGTAVPGGGGFKGGAASRHEGWTRPSHIEGNAIESHTAGRWPANVVIDEHTAAAIDKDSGITKDGVAVRHHGVKAGYLQGKQFMPAKPVGTPDMGYGGEGGASRFFPTFKHDNESGQQCIETTTDDSTSSATDAATEPKSMTEKMRAAGDSTTNSDATPTRADFPTFKYQAKAGSSERPNVDGVAHPTVKPLDLIRWLVRLVTPAGGVVLDPFAGSGTLGEAAVLEHKRAVLIEREPDYLPLIVNRLTKPIAVGFDFGEVS